MQSTRAAIDAATDQLKLDFEAAVQENGSTYERQSVHTDKSLFRMYCLGVAMCVVTLRGFVEEPEKNALIEGMTDEDCCTAYYEAASLALRND